MKNIAVIAEQDRGKSFFIKEEILKKIPGKNYINDINLEYTQFKNEATGCFDIEEFLKLVPNGNNSRIKAVFEEADAFFSTSGTTSQGIKMHINRRFHTKNVNVFVFHSLLEIPTQILSYVDFLILFRTGTQPKKVYKHMDGYSKIIEAFDKIEALTYKTYFNREKKTYPDERSKKYFHEKIILERPFN